MKPIESKKILACAVRAARAVGKLMRQNLNAKKHVNSKTQRDIKLELDVRSQELIGKILAKDFPNVALLGEEGITGDPGSAERWVVDPIDGTVNFAYGIPHACISIAFQVKASPPSAPQTKSKTKLPALEEFQSLVGVVYDPFCDELWTAILGQPARLNGIIIKVSDRRHLRESIVAMGFAKTSASLAHTLPAFNRLIPKIRKIRVMGSAALAMTYVASGRFDGYVERGIRLWDIAAGGLIVECAGGEFQRERIPGEYAYRMVTSNGLIGKRLEPFLLLE